jgi:hypothetical protein
VLIRIAPAVALDWLGLILGTALFAALGSVFVDMTWIDLAARGRGVIDWC